MTMTMLSARGHTADSRDVLLSITARVPLELVVNNAHRVIPSQLLTPSARELRHKLPVPTCCLDQREAERDVYRQLDAAARPQMAEPQPGERCAWCNPAGCMWPMCGEEMACAAPSSPSVPTRRVRRLPTLPWWRRLALRWLGR